MDSKPLSLNKLLLPISGSRCVVSGGKWSKIGGIWGWGCCMLGHGPGAMPWLCLVGQFFMHFGKDFFFVWKFIRSLGSCWENSSIRCSSIHRGVPTLTPCTPQSTKKKGISYPSFEAQCQSDTENEFVSTKSQPEWVSYAVARLTGRSWNRRVQIVKSPRIREAPGGQGRRIAVWVNKRRIGRSSTKVKSTRLEC